MMMLPLPNETEEQFSLRYQKAHLELDRMSIEHDKEMRLSDPSYSRFNSASDEEWFIKDLAQTEKDIIALEEKLAKEEALKPSEPEN